MLDISHLFFVIFVKFNIGKDSMMDLVPPLNLLRDFCMLLFEDSWYVMKLGKELAPGVDNLLVGHPLELNET